MFPLLLGTFPRLFFYCLSAISNSFLQLNEEGQQEIKFHLHLKDVVHVGSSINQRLQHLLLKRKVNCNQTFHSLFSATIPACCWGNWCQHRAQQGGSVSLSSPVSSSPQPPRGSVVSPYWHRSWCLDDMKTSTVRIFQKSWIERDEYLGKCTGPSFMWTGPCLLLEGGGRIGRTMPDQQVVKRKFKIS